MKTSLIAAFVFCSSMAFAQVNFIEQMVYMDKDEHKERNWFSLCVLCKETVLN
ncbi:hypothetical protein GVN16_18820 [Emticicia sp. CRIBPO]|uniref:hypothetical protein n=1 Tax=Emticicia sp. CRIBPO TaxID=2683258 RepID=UPI001411F1DC|nr:hypothetical protein [Emticicia sp. CRIBPO]NBA87830.1 hypothetical protein [Emticicia sp. CRIBPO]